MNWNSATPTQPYETTLTPYGFSTATYCESPVEHTLESGWKIRRNYEITRGATYSIKVGDGYHRITEAEYEALLSTIGKE